MEAVSESKRFLSEPSLETMMVAPQFGLSQIAHNSIPCTYFPLGLCGRGATGHSYCKAYSTPIRRCFVAAVLNLVCELDNSVDEWRGAEKNSVKAVRLKTSAITARKFGGREGARTPDLLVANEKLAVQDVHKVLSVQQNAFSGHKLLRAFSLAHWTPEWTPHSFCDSQNRAHVVLYFPHRLARIFDQLAQNHVSSKGVGQELCPSVSACFSAGDLAHLPGAVDTPDWHAIGSGVPSDIEISSIARFLQKLRIREKGEPRY